MAIFCYENESTGYGYLGKRVREALRPYSVAAHIFVYPPLDAFLAHPEAFNEPMPKIGVFAYDGTDFAPEWLPFLSFFERLIVMVDHSGLSRKYENIWGTFYPFPRFYGLRRRVRRNPQRNLAGTIAHYHPRKYFVGILELSRLLPDWQFSVVTDERGKQILEMAAPPNLQLLTNLTNRALLDWFLSLDCFFSVSIGEVGGLAAAEALTLKIPTILPKHTAYALLPALHYSTIGEVAAFGGGGGGSFFLPNVEELAEILRRRAFEDFEIPDLEEVLEFENVAAFLL